MAHELAFKQNGEAMMAYRGEAPWHRLGAQVEGIESPEDWAMAAGIDWTVSKRGVYLADGSPVPNKMALMRDDTHVVLDVCSDKWEPHQNHEMLEFFRDITEAGLGKIETVGALFGGRDIWALAELSPRFNLVLKGVDPVKQYVLLTGSHRVGFSTKAFYTDVRVVCHNTLSWAEQQAGSTNARIRHNRRFDANAQQALKMELRIDIEALRAQHALYERLTEIQVNERVVNDFTVKLFGNVELYQEKSGSLDEQPRAVPKVIELFDGKAQGADLSTANGTAWGLLNAAIEWVDHHRGRLEESAFNSAWTGQGKREKSFALSLLKDFAHTGVIPLGGERLAEAA